MFNVEEVKSLLLVHGKDPVFLPKVLMSHFTHLEFFISGTKIHISGLKYINYSSFDGKGKSLIESRYYFM